MAQNKILGVYGIIPAMVTPLKDDHINGAALRQLVDYLIAGGVHGLFATGSQGEFYALNPDERRQVWEITLDQAAGRVPVYAGTGAVTTSEAAQLAVLAEKAGVDAISVLTPYFITPSQEELYQHYRAIAEATSLPLLLYGNKDRTGVPLNVDTVARLAEVPNIVGIKDSSGDMTLMAEYIRCAPPSFAVLAGRDTLIYGALCYGAKGAIAATANVAPALVARIYERFEAGDLAGAAEAQRQLAPLRLAFGLGSFPVVIKEALDMMGFQAGPARRPVGPLSESQRRQLREVLEDMGLLARENQGGGAADS
ncbi:MAG: 4-hydroxy-tetrahydrodipicolinate synthase [Anaerolineae bacterium]